MADKKVICAKKLILRTLRLTAHARHANPQLFLSGDVTSLRRLFAPLAGILSATRIYQ